MSTLLQGNRTRRVACNAVFIALAMMLSYLEFLLPLQAMLPLPGFRLGLANLAITVAFCLLSPLDAALISLIRVALTSLLFGSVTSFYFSLLGALFSYLTLFLLSKIGRRCSFLGVSVLCAMAHNGGQLLAAVTLFGSSLLFSYLPMLLLASVLYGGIVGVLLNLCMPKLQNAVGGWLL